MTLIVRKSSADIMDNNFPDYNFEKSFTDLGGSITVVPKATYRHLVTPTDKYIQLVCTNGAAGQVRIQGLFLTETMELGINDPYSL